MSTDQATAIPLRSRTSIPHPLDPLSVAECETARQSILKLRGSNVAIRFRAIALDEPLKTELCQFLDAEHSGTLSSNTPRPPRVAKAQYDVVNVNKDVAYTESWIDLDSGDEVRHRAVERHHQAALTTHEFQAFADTCFASPLYNKAIDEFKLPEGFVVTVDPWPYGGPDEDEIAPRYMQGLCFARDTRSGNADSNHYAYPLPIIPILDTATGEIVRIDRLATGGKEDGLKYGTHKASILDHCQPAEYIPELLGIPLRTDLKTLNVVQPDGPSFKVSNESLVEWQKWRFRVGFSPREGATLHDVRYDGRSVLYRLSLSEMTVPYGDPRPPFHRKQAFDFGDAGAGRAANNLELGCDCLGTIKYFDAVMAEADGSASVSKNVRPCTDPGSIGWKHTNFRTGRAVVTRSRELVIQFIITLANYEYIFAYKLDQAGAISVETRATGIVSVVNIDPGKTSPWGNVVSAGALAQNHQHIFCIRIDPAIDGNANTVIMEESLPMPMSKEINPFGNGYEVRQTPVTKSQWIDAEPRNNRVIKITNQSKYNPVSGKPVSYKFTPSATQLLLAHPDSILARRAQFAQHHVWVTKYKDGELWAGGEFTNQSKKEVDGVSDAVARQDIVENEDVVVWNVFGLTHNPRTEDWPVMPVEIFQLHISPSDFFTANPAIDVPGSKNQSSILAPGAKSCCDESGAVQQAASSHLQGTGPDLDPKTNT
ncbi:amine oxidase-7 [Coleophoma crateriformis]|uniref:Amine oxidase n=1 Tax=Coleophoma crateriformis TaxID=565419 RepID=A0A3D8QZ51_9HELO|nr:amine oxidase-7 [Coleophoma crateriformis]